VDDFEETHSLSNQVIRQRLPSKKARQWILGKENSLAIGSSNQQGLASRQRDKGFGKENSHAIELSHQVKVSK